MITLTFHGAARTVTGSKYEIRAGGDAMLVDCGVFQGLKELRLLNWAKPEFNPAAIKWVVLTHAHTDHSSYLPRLYKLGFRGKVLCSGPTKRLAEIMLLDAAHLQEEDARFLNKKKATRHKPAMPLFDTDDARGVLKLFEAVRLDRTVELSRNLSFRLRPVGHILGACSVVVTASDGGASRTIFFSGDVGRYDMPLLPDPSPPVEADYLVLESTYGDRLHPEVHVAESLAVLVERIVGGGGVLLIPAFAVGRSQQLVVILRRLEEEGRIPRLPIHVDSPMAINATEVFCDFPDLHRVDLPDGVFHDDGTPCAMHDANISYHRSRESSMALNELKGPRIIISASGMLTGGRVLHHLIQRAGDPANIVALAGYQAMGTRGRRLKDGQRTVRFHGQEHTVRAAIEDVGGLSGHADYAEIMRWLKPLRTAPVRTFVTHGEAEPAAAMAERLKSERGFETYVPELGEGVAL